MKTSIRKSTCVAVLLIVVPLGAIAQTSASQPGLVNRSVERLTLLPGPYLLSPARTTPTMAPSPLKMDAASSWSFVPAPPPSAPPRQGVLKLMDRAAIDALSDSNRVPEPPAATRPSPESLRFNSTLESPRLPSTIQMKFVPAERK